MWVEITSSSNTGGDLMSEEMVFCSHCGGEDWEDELHDGKCVMCIVNDCHHSNFDEVDSERSYKNKFLIINYVCMDCEVCWTITHKLDNGIKSKYHHENCNDDDIYQE